MADKNQQLSPYPLGAHREGNGIRASFISEKENCGLVLYRKEDGKMLRRIPFAEENRLGNVRYGFVEDVDPDSVTYQFYEDDKVLPDPCGRLFAGQSRYGEKRTEKELKACFLKEGYDWQGDERPKLAYEDCICYLLHVRGFTKHASSGVTHKGTFPGIAEKLPYLKKLGITTVELQPAYEFIELEEKELPASGPVTNARPAIEEKLNYWGYKKGFYYAPKAAYAVGSDPSVEFRDMVKAFHQNGMEVIMQFYFPREISSLSIVDILRFWVWEYHVDGFRLIGEEIPGDLPAAEPSLADTKLWLEHIDERSRHKGSGTGGDKMPAYRNLAVYRDDYLCDMRRFLKSDRGMLGAACYQMCCNPPGYAKINFFSNYSGFTMMDMVSYQEKHNEANGEKNRDGSYYNFSWNCGEEGPSRKKKVAALRKKQLQNAMSLLFLSQGTPLLFMGDEFGNSQKGNNNPYCQDNEVTWLDWKDQMRNRELYDFTAFLIAFRKAHPMLHLNREPRLTDYLLKGYPELSYHGEEPWLMSVEQQNRQIGMMYCGDYAADDTEERDAFLYLALNMYWEERSFAMPELPEGLQWEPAFMTGEKAECTEGCVPPRTVAVFISREIDDNE